MPSGKTLAQRFNFPQPPVIFAVANGDPPIPVNFTGLVKPWQLRRKVQNYLKADVVRIDSIGKFRSFCSSRRACVVVGFKNEDILSDTLALLFPILPRFRSVRAVAVDTSLWKVKLDSSLAAARF